MRFSLVICGLLTADWAEAFERTEWRKNENTVRTKYSYLQPKLAVTATARAAVENVMLNLSTPHHQYLHGLLLLLMNATMPRLGTSTPSTLTSSSQGWESSRAPRPQRDHRLGRVWEVIGRAERCIRLSGG
jgi:hypothetical protein